MCEGDLILYSTKDATAIIRLPEVDGTVGLTQLEMAELFDTNLSAADVLTADEADIAQLEALQKAAKGRKKGDEDA